MKKIFSEPHIEIIRFSQMDIITTSSVDVIDGLGNDIQLSWDDVVFH